jgi:hypothetical protein
MDSIGCPKAQKAEDVEDNYEQDAEQNGAITTTEAANPPISRTLHHPPGW